MSDNEPAIGQLLRTARERLGLSIVQAAERLHVDAAVIEALEEGRFASLGAPVFVRGHLRRYADLLGEPDAPLQAQYTAMAESAIAPDLTALPRVPIPMSRPRQVRWPLWVAAAVLLLALVAYWAMRTGKV
jgi:cytoskeleton protein RodZ